MMTSGLLAWGATFPLAYWLGKLLAAYEKPRDRNVPDFSVIRSWHKVSKLNRKLSAYRNSSAITCKDVFFPRQCLRNTFLR